MQAVCAGLALIGLAIYTWFTDQMTDAALQTRRLSLSPYLVASVQPDTFDTYEIEVINVAAPAVNRIVWGISVPDADLSGIGLRKPDDLPGFMTPVISQTQSHRIQMAPPREGVTSVYVVDCHDTADGKYQLQIYLGPPDEEGMANVENVWVIPDLFVSPWKRLLNRYRQQRPVKVRKKAKANPS